MHRKDILIIFHEGKYSSDSIQQMYLENFSSFIALYVFAYFCNISYICNFVQLTKLLDINDAIIVAIP